MNTIVLYQGEGVAASSFEHLLYALDAHLSPEFTLKAVDQRFFLSDDWESSTAMLVFPGGRDLYYHNALKGEGNARIRSYVESGGRYLGICAGAYYAASHIEFEKGSEIEVVGARELAFFPGRAIGPAYGMGQFCYYSEVGSRTASIAWERGISPIYFNGGCYFEQAEEYPSIRVIARYHDLPNMPAAVIHCQVGRGVSLLSGVHPEYSAASKHFSSTYNRLTQPESLREEFLKYLINKILT